MDNHGQMEPAMSPAVLFRALAGLLIALGGCQTAHPTHRGEETVRAFLDALNKSGHVANARDTFWLLEVHHESDTGWAWIGEVRDEVLYVVAIECDFSPCVMRVIKEGRYEHFTAPRKAALIQAFTTPTGFVSGRDYWIGSVSSFSGQGQVFVQTVTFNTEIEVEHVAEWIANPDAAAAAVHQRDRVPIELSVPWVISRYYAAGR